MSSWLTSWIAALRISRREALRNKSRNILIIAMLMLPVFGVTALETVLNSTSDLSTQERLARIVGTADAWITRSDAQAVQQSTSLPTASLPANWAQQVASGDPGGEQTTTAQAADPSSTITMPASFSLSGKAATFTVVGEMYQPDDTKADEAFALPTAPDATGESTQGWFVLNQGGVSWSQVQAMNTTGYVVTSREVTLDPPPSSQVPYNTVQAIRPPGMGTVGAAQAAVLAIAVGIALLEVVLLAGPAFAVSARRREREYAIIGAAGASGSHLRRIVLADGVLLGAAAGLAGAGLGFGVGAAVLPWLGRLGSLPGHVHVDVLRVVGVAVLSMLLGLCSAWMPARSVAARDILATLSGRRIAPSTRVRAGRVVKGLALIALGACAVFLHQRPSPAFGAVYIVAGVAFIEVGGIICTPAVIGGLARLGRILPLGPRLALRDSARHTGRTTPAVAAMFAAVAGAVAAGAWLDSSLIQGRDTYQPALMSTQIGLPSVTDQKQATQIVSELSGVIPITGSMTVEEVNAFSSSDTSQWELSALSPSDPGQCTPGTSTQSGTPSTLAQFQGCGTQIFGTDMATEPIGGPAVLKELTGIDDANADAALDQGGAVVFTPGLVRDGRMTLVLQHAFVNDKPKPGNAAAAPETTMTTTYFTAPAVYENPQGIPNPGIVVSPALAQRMDATNGGTLSLVMNLSSHITASQQYAANQALDGLGLQNDLLVENGYTSHLGLANLIVLAIALLLAIGAAAIATGLALADGRADHETLTAVGGSPWTRRWLAGSTALVITGLGIVIGVPIGFVISAGLVRVSNLGLAGAGGTGASAAKAFVVPWLNLGALVVAVPLLTALGAMALARSKTPRIRRIEF